MVWGERKIPPLPALAGRIPPEATRCCLVYSKSPTPPYRLLGLLLAGSILPPQSSRAHYDPFAGGCCSSSFSFFGCQKPGESQLALGVWHGGRSHTPFVSTSPRSSSSKVNFPRLIIHPSGGNAAGRPGWETWVKMFPNPQKLCYLMGVEVTLAGCHPRRPKTGPECGTVR